MSAPSGTQPNPFIQYYNEWSDKTPFVTRCSMVTIIVCYILSIFMQLDLAFGNIPYYTVYKFEIYRLILSPWVGNSLLMIVFTFLFFPAMGGRMESGYGSAFFLYMLLFFTIAINLIFTLFCVSMGIFGSSEMMFLNSSGFWTLVFALLTMECTANPEAPRRIMFIPVNIPSQYYPIVLFVFFTLFSGIQYHYAFAIVVGYNFQIGRLDRFKPTSYYLESLEASQGVLHSISRSKGWVLAGAALGHDAWIPVNTADPDRSSTSSAPTASTGAASIGRGFSSMGTPSATGAGSASSEEKKELFPGSGHTLGSQSRSVFGGKTESSAALNREALANKRLAALGMLPGNNGANNGNSNV